MTMIPNRTPRVLPDLAQQMAELRAELATLAAENAALKAKPARVGTCKVSEKGALSIYGLGRFPITLYLTQFDKLVASWDSISSFVEANRDKFSTKE